MAISKTIEVLNAMQADGVIGRYAIAGAVAAYTYIESTVTEDLDVLVAFADTPDRKISGLVSLEPILAYLAERGYSEHRKEGIAGKFSFSRRRMHSIWKPLPTQESSSFGPRMAPRSLLRS